MRTFRASCALAAAVTVAAVAMVQPAPAADGQPFELVALGDMPYKLPEDYKRFEALIAAINGLRPTFSIHIGDIKSGSSPCSDENLTRIRDYFKTFQQPLIYTPGDNEWTDCHREKAGKFDPLERLAFVRKLFFPDSKSQGAAPIEVIRQADVSGHKDLVENARWSHGGVLFATVDVVGSNNGFERTVASATEYFARNAASTAWIDEAFAAAKRDGQKAVVIAFQANPYFEREQDGASGFRDTVAALGRGAAALARPVLVIHGDDHFLLIDQPLKDKDGNAIETAFRLQVMGETHVHAVRVAVDPADPAVFSFRPLIVPANLIAPSM